VLGDAGDIKLAVRQVVADVLASRTRLSSGGCSDSLIASMRAAAAVPAGLSPAVRRSARPLPGLNNLPKQLANAPATAHPGDKNRSGKNGGQLSHSCQ
jgi:hypothetical protein